MIVGHLSDIHIRLYARHAEYREVFSRLYEWIDETLVPLHRAGKEEVVLVLTGDILHNKIELTPECILITLEFFQELARRLPTLVIAGNHDALLNNRDRVDSLTAVLRDRSIPGLHYLKDTGVYRFGKTAFHVLSLLDPRSETADNVSSWYRDSLLESGEEDIKDIKHVALFHGGVGRYRLQNNFYHDSSIPLSSFQGYDAVMLGDIHLHQFLAPTIAYAGSLLSQNAGETDPNHGVLVWDLDAGKTRYHVIPNPWAYTTIRVTGDEYEWKGQVHPLDQIAQREDFPHRGRIRVGLPKTTRGRGDIGSNELKLLVRDTTHRLQRLLPSAVWTVVPEEDRPEPAPLDPLRVVATPGTMSVTTSLMEAWLHSPEQFLQEYLSTTTGAPTAVPESVLHTFRTKCLEAFTSRKSDDFRQSRWKILKVEWDHLFGYGEHQSLDLESMKPRGIATLGVFGPNSSGKSTLIDILTFLLFNKITRWAHGVSIPSEVIHVRSSKAWGSVLLECGGSGTRYRVVKTLSRAARSGKISLKEEVWEVDAATGKDLRAVHLEQKRQTDSWLRGRIGEYDAFLFLSVCLQRLDRSSFRDMTQKERKEKFFRHFHLDFLESASLCEEWEKELREIVVQCIRLEDRLSSRSTTSSTEGEEEENVSDIFHRMEGLSQERIPWEARADETRDRIREGERRIQQEAQAQDALATLETTMQTVRDEKNKLSAAVKINIPITIQESPPGWTDAEVSERKTLQQFLTQRDPRDRPPLPYECRAGDPSLFLSGEDDPLRWWIPACPATATGAAAPCASCARHGRRIERGCSETVPESTITSDGPVGSIHEWMRKATTVIRNKKRSRLWDFPTDLSSPPPPLTLSLPIVSSVSGTAVQDTMTRADTNFQSLQEQIEDLEQHETRFRHQEEESRLIRSVTYRVDECAACRDNPYRHRGLEQQASIDTLHAALHEKKAAVETRLASLLSIMQPLVSAVKGSIKVPTRSRWSRIVDRGGRDAEAMYRRLLGVQERVEQEELAVANQQAWKDLWAERLEMVSRAHHAFLRVYKEDSLRYQAYQDTVVAHETYRKTWEDRHARYKQLESLWERHEAWTRRQRVRDLEARLRDLETEKAVKVQEHREILRSRADRDAHEKQLRHILQQLDLLREKQIALEVEKRAVEARKEERLARNASYARDKETLSQILQRRDLLEFLVKKVFHRDGFPLFMLRKLIGEFESRLETILEPFFPTRKLRLQIDETGTSIHMRIENTGDGTTMQNLFLGGMEGLMVDVGMKVVWNMISTEPRCNLFVLDENISVLDQSHLQNLRHIFEFLEQHFDHVLVISHLDIVKDFVHGCLRTATDPETNKRFLTVTA